MSRTPHRRVILDMDSSESPVHGEQEGASYNGHFGSTFQRLLETYNLGNFLRRLCLPKAVKHWSCCTVKPERAGQADQDGRPSGAALPAIDLSCLPKAVKHWSLRSVQVKLIKMGGRLVRHSRRLIFQLSEVSVPRGSVGSYRSVIAGAKLREGTTTILPRGRALQGVGLSSMRFHPIGGGPKTTKMDKNHGSRQESYPLLDRLEIDWPCRT